MDETQTGLREKFINASIELEKQLEPEVLVLWRSEGAAYIDSVARGETCALSPLALAIMATIWAHITDGIELDFPPELAAHYHRAPRAPFN